MTIIEDEDVLTPDEPEIEDGDESESGEVVPPPDSDEDDSEDA